MSAFDLAFEMLIGHEGGYVNNPRDPGGETKFGISRRSYPNLDIRNLTLDQARAIYRRDFWNRMGCDDMPDPLALLVFDAAVNNGVGAATRLLQRSLKVDDDGVFGPKSRKALADHPDTLQLCVEFQAQRIHLMASLPTWRTFGLGWSRRLSALAMQAALMEARR